MARSSQATALIFNAWISNNPKIGQRFYAMLFCLMAYGLERAEL